MTKTIKLSAPIQVPGQPAITAIRLREPTYQDFIVCGMPVTWASLSDGGFESVSEVIIDQYIERLADIDPNILGSIGLRDTLAIRGEILSFFREALAPLPAPKQSEASPAPSSLGSASSAGPWRS
jgi:hypothetical protein